MIIQVRGTSGSGKSTVVRQFMELYVAGSSARFDPVYREKRKAPLYYQYGEEPNEAVIVLGHYESPCGGCDTIGSAREVFELISSLRFRHLVCEGLLLSEDTKWSLQLDRLHALFLTTPLDRCLSQIKGRREAAGNEKELDPKNTTNRVATIERARVKLLEAGRACRRVTPEQAPSVIMSLVRRVS